MTRLGGLGGLVLGLSLVASRSVSSFEITRVEQTDQNLEPGQTARLVCRASQDWEFCQWRLSQTDQVLQLCSLEWKLIKVISASLQARLQHYFQLFPILARQYVELKYNIQSGQHYKVGRA